MIGVIYKFQRFNKLNGSLFYGFEYAKLLNVPLYIVDITDSDLLLVKRIFSNKYNCDIDNLIPIKIIELFKLNLDKTLILDIKTFYTCKEFLTNDIHVFSNDSHEMFRYKNNRTVTYYGSYYYQNFDVFNYIKLNFSIFNEIDSSENCVFISGPFLNDEYIYSDPTKPTIMKKHDRGEGNLFELIDSVHYIHSQLDTNNRIIPEALYYNKKVTIEDNIPHIKDSVTFRYDDIIANGLDNYNLTNEDEMIKACLKSNN